MSESGALSPSPNRKIKRTFALSGYALDALAEMAKEYEMTLNAVVNRAILKEYRRFQRELRAKGWAAAAKDPLFLRDIEELGEEATANLIAWAMTSPQATG